MSAPEQAEFTFLPLGAIIQEFRVGGHNIVLGFPTQGQYVKYNTAHYGATIGRVANRIKNGVIDDLNGEKIQLAQNNGPNALHGGPTGWGKRVFDGPHTVQRHGRDALLFKYLCKHGEEGYPGTVEVRVWYTASKEGEAITVLTAEYEVEFVGDEAEETENHFHPTRSTFLFNTKLTLTHPATSTSVTVPLSPEQPPNSPQQTISHWTTPVFPRGPSPSSPGT
jgi:aldose 1-epimerase